MPPRTKKTKVQTEQSIVSDDPIIYFLKVPKDRQDLFKEKTLPEAFENKSYSDILKEEENVNNQFDQTIIQSIISKIHLQTEYPPNTACFWCCHPFSWNSFILPINYDFYINQYVAEGNFCSPECSLAWCYKDISLTDSQRWIRHSLLRELYSELYKNSENIICYVNAVFYIISYKKFLLFLLVYFFLLSVKVLFLKRLRFIVRL
jgi:hypothetical protein